MRSIKQGVTGTGGGPANPLTLTPLEERLLDVLGGCNSPLPVMQNPIEIIVSSISIILDSIS